MCVYTYSICILRTADRHGAGIEGTGETEIRQLGKKKGRNEEGRKVRRKDGLREGRKEGRLEGQDRTGQNRTGQDRTGQDRTGRRGRFEGRPFLDDNWVRIV
jgi:hypothetical protein